MKTLGIIGGLGPDTTSKVYLEIIQRLRKAGVKRYPAITIYNLPFPFQVEQEAAVMGVNTHKMIPYLTEGAKILEKSGATFGILPCNTLHKYIENIRQAVKIPFISIIDELARDLAARNIKTVGILGTKSTMQDGLYENALAQENLEILYPEKADQNILSGIIGRLLAGKITSADRARLKKIIGAMSSRGVHVIVLACTDLQLIAPAGDTEVPIVDTTDVLISSVVRYFLK